MEILNFDYEFDRFLFRGNKADIDAIYDANSDSCAEEPVCIGNDIWEVEVCWGDFLQVIRDYPLVKATGFILNWENRSVNVAYSKSGSCQIDKIKQIAGFDGHADADFRWYATCPITATNHACKEFYSNVGEYDRFSYSFPYAAYWGNNDYAASVLSEQDLAFQISSDGVLIKCDSREPIIRIPEGVRVIGSKAFVDSPYGSNDTVVEILLPHSLRVIEDEAFYSCHKLTSVKICEGLESIGKSAFFASAVKELSLPMSLKELKDGCFMLSRIARIHIQEDHPVFAMENQCLLDKVNHRFIRCLSDETSVTVPDGIVAIDASAFYEHKNLQQVTLPQGLLQIGDSAFQFCRSLRRVYLPDGVTTLGSNVFEFCNALEHVDLPASITKIGSNAFSYCTSINHLVIPEGVPGIEFGTFSQCSSLSDLTLPSTITYMNGFDMSGLTSTPWYTDRRADSIFTIGSILVHYKNNESHVVIPQGISVIFSSAFAKKTKLEQVDLPEGLKRIEGNAFSGCTKLTKVLCPDSVTTIFSDAFADCPSLEYFYAAGVEKTTLPFGNGKAISDTAVVVLPKVKFGDQTPAALKLALCRGFLSHPEVVCEELREENLATVLKLRKKLLPWVFSTDNVDALKFFLNNVKTTKAKLKSEYLTPAQNAGAQKCLEYLAGVSV